jgi:SanA protein
MGWIGWIQRIRHIPGEGRAPKAGCRGILKRSVQILLILCVCGFLETLAINLTMTINAQKYIIRDIKDLPQKTAILVLGSQTSGTRLSLVLQERVIGGISLMEAHKGRKLLLSGDHGDRYYDEVNAMRLYVLDHSDIAPEDIFMDHAGFKTYDSMYRARDIFEVKDLIIVTQEFHISRAVFIARGLGLDATGYAVGHEKFRKSTLRYWEFREYFARVKAFFSVVFKAKPRYLGDPIPITGDGRQTWI